MGLQATVQQAGPPSLCLVNLVHMKEAGHPGLPLTFPRMQSEAHN